MNKKPVLRWSAILMAMGIVTVNAHHAMEYLETESYTTPRKGEQVLYLRYDYIVEDKDDPTLDRWEITPGYTIGLTDRLMLDVHGHFAKFGVGHIEDETVAEQYGDRDPSPFFEAVAASLQYRVTEGRWVDIAVAARVEVPSSRARAWLGSDEVYEGVLILSKSFAEHSNVTLNFIYGVEGSEDHYEFALGLKTPISANPHGPAVGFEVLGDLEDVEDSWSVVPGLYVPLAGPETMLKFGAEIGKDARSTSAIVMIMHLF